MLCAYSQMGEIMCLKQEAANEQRRPADGGK